MNLEKLVERVEQWSIDKGLDKAESSKQYLKVGEESGEVAAALARNDKDALRDGIGDVVVTLIILAQQNGMTLEECLQQAYDEIKGRTGQMVDGVFVKSEDLIKN
uniref:MazG-like family protein n=1 Tax=Sporosarcina sp. FSL K6-1522 TaxID=2921554 RepID=UPI00406C2EE2